MEGKASAMSDEIAQCWRDGELIYQESFNGALRILYCRHEETKVLKEPSKPGRFSAAVLKDQFNPEYDECFPLVEIPVDVYVLGHHVDGVWHYHYDSTEHKQYYKRS